MNTFSLKVEAYMFFQDSGSLQSHFFEHIATDGIDMFLELFERLKYDSDFSKAHVHRHENKKLVSCVVLADTCYHNFTDGKWETIFIS